MPGDGQLDHATPADRYADCATYNPDADGNSHAGSNADTCAYSNGNRHRTPANFDAHADSDTITRKHTYAQNRAIYGDADAKPGMGYGYAVTKPDAPAGCYLDTAANGNAHPPAGVHADAGGGLPCYAVGPLVACQVQALTFPEFFNAVIVVLMVIFTANSIAAAVLIRRTEKHQNALWICFGISMAGAVAYCFAMVYRNLYADGLPSVIVSAVLLAWAVFVAVGIFTILWLIWGRRE